MILCLNLRKMCILWPIALQEKDITRCEPTHSCTQREWEINKVI